MFKDSSASYYEDNRKRLQKMLVKDIKVFVKMNKKKQHCGCERYKNST